MVRLDEVRLEDRFEEGRSKVVCGGGGGGGKGEGEGEEEDVIADWVRVDGMMMLEE